MHLHRITFNDILESRRWMTRRIVRFDDHERRRFWRVKHIDSYLQYLMAILMMVLSS
jgi:hypothetical protein